jgi:hypothetical protein
LNQILSAVLVALVGWFLWVFSPSDDCERIYRGASMVRGPAALVRWALENHISQNDRITLLSYSIEADMWTRRALITQFYAGKIRCDAPRKAP